MVFFFLSAPQRLAAPAGTSQIFCSRLTAASLSLQRRVWAAAPSVCVDRYLQPVTAFACVCVCLLLSHSLTVVFTLTGQSGLGKSTLMNTLFKSKVSRRSVLPAAQEKIPKTVEIKSISHGEEALLCLLPCYYLFVSLRLYVLIV